jgi:hypothetical protein
MEDEVERRLAINEAIFREVNERIAAVGENGVELDIICECGDSGCVARVLIAIHGYESVRAEPRRFIIVPGHEMTEIEFVVEENERYVVVQKREGEPALVAEQFDERS